MEKLHAQMSLNGHDYCYNTENVSGFVTNGLWEEWSEWD